MTQDILVMKRSMLTLVNILFSLAIVWLLFAGLQGVAGIVSAIVVLVSVILAVIIERKFTLFVRDDKGLPLLFNVLLFVGCTILAIFSAKDRVWFPFFILIALGGLLGIILWLSDGKNRNKTLKRLLAEDLKLMTSFDLGFVAFFILLFIREGFDIDNSYWIILCFVIVDLVHQVQIEVEKTKGKKSDLTNQL